MENIINRCICINEFRIGGVVYSPGSVYNYLYSSGSTSNISFNLLRVHVYYNSGSFYPFVINSKGDGRIPSYNYMEDYFIDYRIYMRDSIIDKLLGLWRIQ